MSARPPAAILRARIAALALLTVFGMNCRSGTPTAPSGSLLTLATPTKSVSVNGTAVFTAELLSGAGQPMVGASITFTTTLGTIEPAQAVTNGNGQATAVLSTGTASGTAVVVASSGTARATPVSLVVGTAAVGRVAMTASPASVPFGGGNSVITAVVTDAAGNPLKSMPVGFTTTAGNLTPANAKTDTNGIVQTTLTTSASAVVTAVAGASPVDTAGPQIPTLTGSVTVGVASRPVPIVSIAASPNAVAFSPVTFTLGATPAPGTNTTIQNVSVDFGDGDRTNLGAVSGTAIVVQHVYAAGGTYTVSMTATDSAGGMAIATTVLAVRAAVPLAVSVVAGPMLPTGGGPKAIVSFTATVIPLTSVISSYLWDFGDGGGVQRTTSNQVQHVFANPGLYIVTVTVTEALTERTAVGTVPVSTASDMPTVSVTASANPVAGRAMTFAIAAAVALGTRVNIESVRVTFGDGTPPLELGGVSGSGITAGHVYASAGTYLVTVSVRDTAGGRATAAAQVVVVAPTAPSVSVAVTGSSVAVAPTTFTISAAPAAGSGSTIQNVRVTFGDGTPDVDLGAVNGATTTQHVYAASGNYTVTATATDSAGVTATASVQVTVAAPGAPGVAVTASANPIAGSPVTFNITAAPAAGSNTTITNVRVNFADGTAPVDLGAVSSPMSAQHVFAAAGNYNVSATATASNGATATASTQVVVAPAPANAPSVSVIASPNPVAGTATSFTITAAPAPGSNTTIQKVVVAFGDGSVVDLGAVSSPATTQHVFTAAGNYTVTATATASNNASTAASTQVVVAAAPANVPTVSVIASPNPVAGIATSFTITAAPAPGSNTTIQKVVVAFGDGSVVDLGAVSSPATTQHVYNAAGNYTVTATATASNNATAAASTQVVVAAPGAPSVSVTASANPVAGTTVTFTITAAPAPGSNTTIANVQVNFGDGTVVDLGAVSSPMTAQHVFAVANTYSVTATARASNNATASASTQVVVAAPGAPSVSVTASPNSIVGSAVTFTITAAPAPGSNTTITKVVMDFGDGSSADLGVISSPATTEHVYKSAATYTVSATATSSSSATTTASIQVVVAPRPTPSVSISASANPVTLRPVTFTLKVAAAPGVNTPIQSVLVNFGDGSSTDLGAATGDLTVQHAYTTAGTFTASATVTDLAGASSTANTPLSVVAAATVSLAVSASPQIGQSTTLTATATPATSVTIQNVSLRYGDNSQDELGAVSGTLVRNHVYATSGTFAASVVVTLTGLSGSVTASATVVVAPCPQFTTILSVDSVSSATLGNWPGTEQVHSTTAACSVTVKAPSGNISNLSGDTWTITGAAYYSLQNCAITTFHTPICRSVGASAGVQGNGRPYCSNSSIVFGSDSTASVTIQCK